MERLLRLIRHGGILHGEAGVVVDGGQDVVDLVHQVRVGLPQAHAGALGREGEAVAVFKGDQAEVRVGGQVAGGRIPG